MKLNIVFWVLLSLASETCASPKTAAWQMVMWYYTYRVHVAVLGNAQTTFAPCMGSNGDHCTLDEFARAVQRLTNNYPRTRWTIGTVDGRGLGDLPDPLQAVQAIESNLGKDVYTQQQDPAKMFPNIYKGNANVRFDNQIILLDQHMEVLRKMIADNVDGRPEIYDWPDTAEMWRKFRVAVQGHKEMRLADQWGHTLATVEAAFARAGYSTVTEQVTSAADGHTTWTQIDTEGTLMQNSRMTSDIFRSTVDGAMDASSQRHLSAIQHLDRTEGNTRRAWADRCK